MYQLVFGKVYCKDGTENLEGEEWREVKGTSGNYLVSNKGRVKSLSGYEAVILSPFEVKGYGRVDIVYDGERFTKLVSRLVA